MSGTEKQLDGISTMLVSRKPFSAEDQQNFEKLCYRPGFTLLLTPDFTVNAVYAGLSSSSDYRNFAAN